MKNLAECLKDVFLEFRLKPVMFFVSFLLLATSAQAQLSNFTLTVTKINESCSGHGSLNFAVANTTPGATIIYSVFLLPDISTPIATQAATTLNGLTAGTYQVIATQSLGPLSNTQQQNITIISTIVPLTFTLTGTNSVCNVGGTITVTPTGGTAVTYELLAGPVIMQEQSSNVFTGLTPGVYQVRVFDNCGEGVVQTYELFNSDAGLAIYVQTPTAGDCDTLIISLTLSAPAGNAVAYPLTIQCVVNPSTGPPLVYNQTIASNTTPFNFINYSQTIPYIEGTVYTYTVTITDNCGNVYNTGGTINNFSILPTASFFNSTCIESGIYVSHITALTLLTAPTAYQGAVPQNLTSQITPNHSLTLTQLPTGTYTFLATGLCGEQVTLTVVITPPPPSIPNAFSSPGCDPGFGSFAIYGDFVSVTLNSAPASYPAQLPMDFGMYIDPITGSVTINTVPAGQYLLHTIDICGNEYDVTANVVGYLQNTQVNIIENCNSFNLQLAHTSNGQSGNFWLQQYDSVNNQWFHPDNGTLYTEGTVPNTSNSISLANNAITYNLGYTGNFRVVKSFSVFGNGTSNAFGCIVVIYEFAFNPGPEIINVYSFQCVNNTHDLIVDAVGLPPLKYRITLKNGVPFIIDNNNSNIFLSLEPAIYNIQVEDNCGNILNRLFDIPSPFNLTVSGSGLCEGQTGTLNVAYFPFLTYSWWKNNDATTILSTNGTLQFASFNSATDSGIYHVRIKYDHPDSCIDMVLDYEITPASANPQAGSDNSVSFCTRPDLLNLSSLLTGAFDTGGNWQDLSASGALNGSFLSAGNLLPGIYNFQYLVSGLCASDDALITVILNDIPESPQMNGAQVVCSGSDITLNLQSVTGETYQWTGPNGYTSSEAAPILQNATVAMSGNYSVTASNATCTSMPASIDITVIAPPELSLAANCIDNRYTLSVVPTNNSFVSEAASYLWTGPENFSAIGNPVNITGEFPGIYTVSITTAEGCPADSQIMVSATQCTVPLGVSPNNDGLNDTFNLAGFNVENLKIFNRYGMIVYEAAQYRTQWHGQDYKDRPLPAGAYYYLMHLAGGEAQSGWVYVNREF